MESKNFIFGISLFMILASLTYAQTSSSVPHNQTNSNATYNTGTNTTSTTQSTTSVTPTTQGTRTTTVRTPSIDETIPATVTPPRGDGTAPIDVASSNPAIPTPAEDAIITDSIKKQINQSKTLSKLNVGVTTQQGNVFLSGNVDSDSQVSSLVEIAQSIVGVIDVNTGKLTVTDSQQPLGDAMITGKVKGLLIREKIFGGKDLSSINMSVETKNGRVYLTGTVDNNQQIKNAIMLIKTIKGVQGVEYNVKKVMPLTGTQSNINTNQKPVINNQTQPIGSSSRSDTQTPTTTY